MNEVASTYNGILALPSFPQWTTNRLLYSTMGTILILVLDVLSFFITLVDFFMYFHGSYNIVRIYPVLIANYTSARLIDVAP